VMFVITMFILWIYIYTYIEIWVVMLIIEKELKL